MNSTLEETIQERPGGPARRALRWLDSKLSRVTSSREFIPEIDGFRFVAIFFVVVFHAAGRILKSESRAPLVQQWVPGQSLLLAVIGNLFLGVQLFFVISGLVVALPFARSAIQGTQRPSLSSYFMRRLTRIEPPYMLALLVMYYLLHRYRFYLPHLLAGLVYIHKWVFGIPNPINIVTWTLEVEVVFYVLAPWITSIYSIPGRIVRWAWLVLLIGADSYFVHNWLIPFSPSSYCSFAASLPYFLAGVLLADLYVSGLLSRTNRLVWDGAALLGLAALISSYLYLSKWRLAWVGPFVTMMLVGGGIKGIALNRFLRLRAVTLIGGMCYTIYLWHIMFLWYIPLMARLPGFPARLTAGLSDLQLTIFYCLIAVPLIILFSMPIYYVTERPFMNGPGSRFIERVLRAVYGRLQSRLSGWFTASRHTSGLPAESISQEQS
jgi:peptidoglycan/LPS O-acetylase OafA/YrhL